ncbi:hypothetical protein BH09ACT9_BH09ACT9_50190 [soil metagenome]
MATFRRCPAAAALSEPFVHVVRPQPATAHLLVSLAATAAVFVILGLLALPSRPGRQFALPLVLAFLSVAAMVAWFWISMELFFSPD